MLKDHKIRIEGQPRIWHYYSKTPLPEMVNPTFFKPLGSDFPLLEGDIIGLYEMFENNAFIHIREPAWVKMTGNITIPTATPAYVGFDAARATFEEVMAIMARVNQVQNIYHLDCLCVDGFMIISGAEHVEFEAKSLTECFNYFAKLLERFDENYKP